MDSRLLRSVVLAVSAFAVAAVSLPTLGLEVGLLVLLIGLGVATLTHAYWLYRGGTTLDARFVLAMIIVMVGTVVGSSVDLIVASRSPTLPIALIAVCALLIPLDVRGYRYYKRLHGGA